MRALLDINLLIALHDPSHVHSNRAHDWWSINGSKGWASCPISENGFVRISSGPRYSPDTRFTVGECTEMLRSFVDRSNHEFWADCISLMDSALFLLDSIAGPQQVTDIYFLALAVKNGGRLVTFDRRINISAVVGATEENLCILS